MGDPRHDPRNDPFLWWNFLDDDKPRGVQVRWWNGKNQVRVWWGEDGATGIVPIGGRAVHHYESLGAYMVRFRQTGGDQQILAEQQVVIRDGRPAVTVTEDPDDRTALVAHFPEMDPTGIVPSYRIYWEWPGNPSLVDDMLGVPGGGFTKRGLKPGPDKVRINDLTSKWWIERDIDVPGQSIEFGVTAEGRTATLTVTKANEGQALVADWGDTGLLQPVTGGTASHTYPPSVSGVQLVQLAYADGTDSAVQPITIPALGGSL